MPLSVTNIESELSYAYLHALTSRAGMNCYVPNRHADNYGVDAVVEYFDTIPGTYITDVSIRVQLKATYQKLTETDTHFKYYYQNAAQYNKMRVDTGRPVRIFVILLLPQDSNQWLTWSTEQLIIKNVAYWVNLYGAPEPNETGITISIPKANVVNGQSLIDLMQAIAKGDIPAYEEPK